MNALTLVFVALCVFALAYRFYGMFIAKRVLGVDPNRTTRLIRSRTASITTRPTSMYFSDIILRPSRRQVPCSVRSSPLSSAICRAPSGSLSEQ